MKFTGRLWVAVGIVATLMLASYWIYGFSSHIYGYGFSLYGFSRASMADNQKQAFGVMCQFHNAQLGFPENSLDPRPWTSDVAGICTRVKGFPPEVAAADVTNASADAKPYHGYFFKALPLPKKGEPGFGDYGYAIIAFPQEYGRTGRETYYINGFAQFGKDLQGATLSKPLETTQLRATGWSLID
jgi:hypothetical protein